MGLCCLQTFEVSTSILKILKIHNFGGLALDPKKNLILDILINSPACRSRTPRRYGAKGFDLCASHQPYLIYNTSEPQTWCLSAGIRRGPGQVEFRLEAYGIFLNSNRKIIQFNHLFRLLSAIPVDQKVPGDGRSTKFFGCSKTGVFVVGNGSVLLKGH